MEPVENRWLVIGLGNPGAEYASTRHNLGFRVVDELAARRHVQLKDRAAKSLTARVAAGGGELVLAKPQTFMNDSGAAAKALRDKYRVPLERTIVVHDELDLPFGRLRVRRDGGARFGLEHLKPIPEAERVGAERPTQVGQSRVGAHRNTRLEKGQEPADPSLDSGSDIDARHGGDPCLRERPAELRPGDDDR